MIARPLLSDAQRLYVIGDIHGRRDLLETMIAAIRGDLEAHPSVAPLTVTIGDYIDRGPDSKGVIERLAINPFPTEFIALKGNHEAFLEEFLEDPSRAEDWRRLGGIETLASYGVAVRPLMLGKEYGAAAEALLSRLPKAHAEFLASLRLSLSFGPYFLCHAGVRPGVPLSQQKEADLLSIRDEFLSSARDFGKIVVHGHTPAPEPEIRRNRINIDTGAFITGRLTCAVLEGPRLRFLTAR